MIEITLRLLLNNRGQVKASHELDRKGTKVMVSLICLQYFDREKES